MAVGGQHHNIHILNQTDLTLIRIIDAELSEVRDMDFDFANDQIMVCGDRQVKIWKISAPLDVFRRSSQDQI